MQVPPPTAEKPASGSPNPDRRSTMEPGPPAPKPRPKPRHPKKGPEAPADNGLLIFIMLLITGVSSVHCTRMGYIRIAEHQI